MTADLIDSDVLFQSLLVGSGIVPVNQVGAEVNVDTFDKVPFITHSSLIAQNRNGDGLWTCQLSVTAFIEASTAEFNAIIKPLYTLVHSWDWPTNGIVPGVGAVESVENDIQAFTAQGKGVELLNKVITHYTGSFELVIRNP